MKRAIIIVLDSVGIGEAADAANYGDIGANTLLHTLTISNTALPNLQKMGLGNIFSLPTVPPAKNAQAAFGAMAPKSSGKDTTSGHWEICGIILPKPMPTYPNGFPAEIIEAFCAATGRGYLGNKVASGIKIIEELGAKHVASGDFIVYTSADSVFQVAAHEDIIPLTELYAACQKARDILQGEHGVGRVIARPFKGDIGNFYRTENRHDYSLLPPDGNLLSNLVANNLPVASIGKIKDIFAAKGITDSFSAHNNQESLAGIIEAMQTIDNGLIFANLVDFDMLYGHRNDIEGYGQALLDFDQFLPKILSQIKEDDLLFITADHGNDPSFPGTDHNRENVPLIAYGPKVKACDLGLLNSFADLGATIAAYLGVKPPTAGSSFLDKIIN